MLVIMCFFSVWLLSNARTLAVKPEVVYPKHDEYMLEHPNQIPTRQRTPNRTRPSSKYTAQRIPTKKRTSKMTIPTSSYSPDSYTESEQKKESQITDKPRDELRKHPPGFYSQEQHSIRLAKSRKFLNATGHTSFDEALAAAKVKLKEKKFRENRIRRQSEKELGIKPKNYHTVYTRTKEGKIGRKIVKILEEKNGTFKHEVAREEAKQWYRDLQKTTSKRRREARAERSS